jgi:hypothetical protein
MMAAICNDIINKTGGCLVSYTERSRYDETPMKCKVPDHIMLELAAEQVKQASVPSGIVGAFKDSLPTKLCHTEFLVGILVSSGNKFFFEFPSVCWLQRPQQHQSRSLLPLSGSYEAQRQHTQQVPKAPEDLLI